MNISKMIADGRLRNQQISHRQFKKPEEIVQRMCAMQAQDYLASLWAIGLRSSANLTEADVEKTIADGKIVRTWPMRGTLHFVAAEDTQWMLRLLTPRSIRSSTPRHRELELDLTVFSKSRKLFEKHLEGGIKLTRSELYQILERNGISSEDQRGYHILSYLAQKGVICFGPRRGKQHTFTLMDEWTVPGKDLKGDGALAELASRYIISHGPATEYDFASWSGLSVTECRKALEIIKSDVEKVECDGQNFWFPKFTPGERSVNTPFLLPGFDELICGYNDRGAILESDYQKSVILKNGIIKPVIIMDGKVSGTWKRTLKKKNVSIRIEPFSNLTQNRQNTIYNKVQEYGKFLGLHAETL